MTARRAAGRVGHVALLALACGVAPAPALAQVVPLEQLAWLAGCWVDEKAAPGSGESWTLPAGGTMLGAARTVKQGRTVDFEFMQIRAESGGPLVFVAMPSGQRRVEFTAVRASADHLVFENMQHDFPQRIVYRRIAADRLATRIEGERGGALRGFDFSLRRGPCEAPLAEVHKQ